MLRGSPNPLMFMCLGAFQVVLVVKNSPAIARDIRDRQGPAPAGSRETRRRNGVGDCDRCRGREIVKNVVDKKIEERRKEAGVPWFIQKINKV